MRRQQAARCEHSRQPADPRAGRPRPPEGGSRLQAVACLDGAHLSHVRLPEVVRLRGPGADPLHQQRPVHFLDVSRLRCPRRELVPGRVGMAVRCAAVHRVLGQTTGHPGRCRACITFLSTVSIIPFMPDGWAPSAGGFPAMAGNVAFLMKDVVLFAASFYLLRQDVLRVMASRTRLFRRVESKEDAMPQAETFRHGDPRQRTRRQAAGLASGAERGTGRPWWNGDGSEGRARMSPAFPARTRSGAPGSPIWRAMPPGSEP